MWVQVARRNRGKRTTNRRILIHVVIQNQKGNKSQETKFNRRKSFGPKSRSRDVLERTCSSYVRGWDEWQSSC